MARSSSVSFGRSFHSSKWGWQKRSHPPGAFVLRWRPHRPGSHTHACSNRPGIPGKKRSFFRLMKPVSHGSQRFVPRRQMRLPMLRNCFFRRLEPITSTFSASFDPPDMDLTKGISPLVQSAYILNPDFRSRTFSKISRRVGKALCAIPSDRCRHSLVACVHAALLRQAGLVSAYAARFWGP